jgi:hypothetical protein
VVEIGTQVDCCTVVCLMPISGTPTKMDVVVHTTTKKLFAILTATHPVSVGSTTFGAREVSELIVASVMPMLMLVVISPIFAEQDQGWPPPHSPRLLRMQLKIWLWTHIQRLVW